MSCPRSADAGAWVLRALDARDADGFAGHLETCAACRAEVASLQPVADTLPLAAPVAVPPPALRARIMDVVQREAELLRAAGPEADLPPRPARERRWYAAVLRPVPLAALACTLLLAGVVGGAALSGDGGGDVRTVAAEFVPRGAAAELRLSDRGAELEVTRMPPPSVGRVYQVWLKRDGQAPEPTHALFNVRGDGRAVVAIPDEFRDADQLLVTSEPSGGSPAPTRPPVVTATLS